MTANSAPQPGDDRLSAYLDGELSAAERALVEQELATSPATQARLVELQEVSTLLKTWDTTVQAENPSQQFKAFVTTGGQSVSAELRQEALVEDDLPVAPVVPSRSATATWIGVLVAMAVALVIYLAFSAWMHS